MGGEVGRRSVGLVFSVRLGNRREASEATMRGNGYGEENSRACLSCEVGERQRCQPDVETLTSSFFFYFP